MNANFSDMEPDFWRLYERCKADTRTTHMRMIEGRVEQTIPQQLPLRISLLRLDTDWYQSTRHELIHLWPRLVPGGILIVDDYGYWRGSRRAVDEFIAGLPSPPLLTRLDDTGRICIKVNSG